MIVRSLGIVFYQTYCGSFWANALLLTIKLRMVSGDEGKTENVRNESSKFIDCSFVCYRRFRWNNCLAWLSNFEQLAKTPKR